MPVISHPQGYFGKSFISLLVSFLEADLLYISKLNIHWSKWRKITLLSSSYISQAIQEIKVQVLALVNAYVTNWFWTKSGTCSP